MKRAYLLRLVTPVGAALVLFVLAVFVLSSQPLFAATLDVCETCEYTSIQAAVEAAASGDTIRVAAGTFTESVSITQSLTLLGGYTDLSAGTRVPYATIIREGSPVVHIEHRRAVSPLTNSDTESVQGVIETGIDVVLDGFELTAGAADRGAGVYVYIENASEVTLSNNYIHDNLAGQNGGGVYVGADERSAVVLADNKIENNHTAPGFNHHGAGIYASVTFSSSLALIGNVVVSNASGDGAGGMYVDISDLGAFAITDNVIMSNTATTAPGDDWGGIYLHAEDNVQGVFNNNQILSNYSDDDYGGGCFILSNNSDTTFNSNVVRDNTASGVGSSESYAGIALKLDRYSHLTGAGLIVEDNFAEVDYGGVYISADYQSSVNFTGIQALGNHAGKRYAGIYAYGANNTTLNFPNLYLYDNTAQLYAGGGLVANSGNVAIVATGAQVISNTALNNATSNAGGLLVNVANNGLVNLSQASFLSNTVSSLTGSACGGGLFVQEMQGSARVALDSAHFEDNVARSSAESGAAYGAGACFEGGPNLGGSINLQQGEFLHNTAVATGTTATAYGGGAYINAQYYNLSAGLVLTSTLADGAVFEENYVFASVSARGGGIYLDSIYGGAAVSFNDSVFKRNVVSSTTGVGLGGGLYSAICENNCIFSVQGAHFSVNEALGDSQSKGGAIYFHGADLGSKAYINTNHFERNVSSGQGGAVATDYLSYRGSIASFSGNQVLSNTAASNGGGIYVGDALASEGSAVMFNDNRFAGNQAAEVAGAAYLYDIYGSSVQIARNTINANQSGAQAAGLYLASIDEGAQVLIQDNEVTDNLILSQGAYAGGGVYLYALAGGSTLTMTGNSINSNIATGPGGGLYWANSIGYGTQFFFEDNVMQSNRAAGGGGCYFDGAWEDGATVRFDGNAIDSNISSADYGSCYIADISYGVVADFNANTFNGNTAAADVGALSFGLIRDGAQLRFWDNEIAQNRAGVLGTQILGGDHAALHIGSLQDGSEVDIRDVRILTNTAYLSPTGSSGGNYAGIYVALKSSSTFKMQDSLIAANRSEGSFSGVYITATQRAHLRLEHNEIMSNTAAFAGGGLAIHGQDLSQYALLRNRIIANKASVSGALWIENQDLADPIWGYSENNLIAANQGDAVLLVNADFQSTNDTIVDNLGVGVMMTGSMTATTWLSNTIVWANSDAFMRSSVPTYTQAFTMAADYCDIQGSWSGTQNVSVGPLFVGAGDYHLQVDSPLRDMVPMSVAPTVDLDGYSRPYPYAGQADIGAYEYQEHSHSWELYLPLLKKQSS